MLRLGWMALIGCTWMSAASAQFELLGKWEDTPTVMSLELTVGPGPPLPTITSALAAAGPALGVVPVTINVQPGTYNFLTGEAFPILLPAHGVTIEAAALSPTLPIVSGAGTVPVPAAVFLFATVGNPLLPDSVIRGLQIQTANAPGSADIRIAAVPVGAPVPPARVAPEIRDCFLTGDHDIGVDILSVPNTLVTPLLERNLIITPGGPSLNAGRIGVNIVGGLSLISPVVRCNDINRFQTNLSMTGVAGLDLDCRPRIQSNFIQSGNTNVLVDTCAPFLVNNTIAFAFEGVVPVVPAAVGLQLTNVTTLVLTDNCLWNPVQVLAPAIDVLFVPPFPGIPFFNVDEDNTLSTLFPGLNFGPPLFIPQFVGGNGGGMGPPVDLHLTAGSPLINAGVSFDSATPGPGPAVIPAALGAAAPVPIRRDFAFDLDFGARLVTGAVSDIGADEFVPRGTLLTPVVGPSLDGLGNVLATAGVWTAPVLVTGTAGDFCVLVAGTGNFDTVTVGGVPFDNRAVFEHTFMTNPLLGNVAIDLVAPGFVVVASFPLPAGGAVVNVSFGGFSPAFVESEVFLQAVTIDGTGAGEISNRLQFDMN